MVQHPEVLWAQRSSESVEENVSYLSCFTIAISVDASTLFVFLQNFLYITVNLPDIAPDTLDYKLTPTAIHFKAKAGA